MITIAYNQPHVVLSEASLDHLLESAKHYGENIADDKEKLLKKAAFLFYHIAFDFHIFADGNKRTALATAQLFLVLNHYSISIPSGDWKKAEEMVKQTAQGKRSINSIYNWLKSTCTHFVGPSIIELYPPKRRTPSTKS